MDKSEKRLTRRLEALDTEEVVELLQEWDMAEFVELIKEKEIDGRKLMDVTEGIIKLWRPKVNANKLIEFIKELKLHPENYLSKLNNSNNTQLHSIESTSIECQYQVVTRKKSKEESPAINIEDILKRIVPAKSFLYRNQQKKSERPTYLPMNPASPKKIRKFFRLSSYEYPFFYMRSRFKQENTNTVEKGYYSMKRNSNFYVDKPYKKPEERAKYISLPTTEELSEKYQDDHFYEDLCYNEMENKEGKAVISNPLSAQPLAKPCLVKIQELFQSFKIPFFKKTEEVDDKKIEEKPIQDKHDVHIYENSEDAANMYDSIHVDAQQSETNQKDRTKLPVEDYLEPMQMNKDYVNVLYKQKDDSILGYILSIFENRFGMRRVSVPLMLNLGKRVGASLADLLCRTVHCFTDVVAETNDQFPSEESENDSSKPSSPPEWCEERRGRSMVDRPLPVPVENEPYYMNIDRSEAENLLKGQPDGMFVLRPSSQANHAYTLSVSCTGVVHNIGVRRKQDGRLTLGFARRGQRTFPSVTSLLRHHRRRRLLLVADGTVVGATTLNDTPQYYQTPSNMPVPVTIS